MLHTTTVTSVTIQPDYEDMKRRIHKQSNNNYYKQNMNCVYTIKSQAYDKTTNCAIVRGDRDSRATLMPIYGDLYQIKL